MFNGDVGSKTSYGASGIFCPFNFLLPYLEYSDNRLSPLTRQQLPYIFIIGTGKGCLFMAYPGPVVFSHAFQEITRLVDRRFPTSLPGACYQFLAQPFRHTPWCRIHPHKHGLFCFNSVIDHSWERIDSPSFGFRQLVKINS